MGIHPRRGDANVGQQRQPLSPATADVEDSYAVPACLSIDELSNIRQVDTQLGCDLLRRAAEASSEVGIEGGETGPAPVDLLPELGQILLQFRRPLTGCRQVPYELLDLGLERLDTLPQTRIPLVSCCQRHPAATAPAPGSGSTFAFPGSSGRGMVRNTLAGFPATMVYGSTSLSTSDPTPTTEWAPIRLGAPRPDAPRQTSSSRGCRSARRRYDRRRHSRRQ